MMPDIMLVEFYAPGKMVLVSVTRYWLGPSCTHCSSGLGDRPLHVRQSRRLAGARDAHHAPGEVGAAGGVVLESLLGDKIG